MCDLEWRHWLGEHCLLFNRLLAVLWNMDDPTRNQSLHSYWGNRWANMFPGGCPYYSGATGPLPQETVEPDGIDRLSLLNEQVMNYCGTNGWTCGRRGILSQWGWGWVAASTKTRSLDSVQNICAGSFSMCHFSVEEANSWKKTKNKTMHEFKRPFLRW